MFIDRDGRKIQAPGRNGESLMTQYQPTTGMISYLGPGDSANVSAFLGVGDGMGQFFARTDGGGGGSSTSGPTPKSNTGPGVIERFISWLFGGKKKAGRLEVGQVERVPMSYGQTALFGLIRNANINANGESPLEAYRAYRDDPMYHEGESWADRFARNVNSSHMEILLDEGSGGGLMFGGYGKVPSLISKVSAEAELQGFKSFNTGINPDIVAQYFEEMSTHTFNRPIGVGGFEWEGKYYFNEGNHKMNAAIQYKIKTGDYKYMDMLMNNAKFDNANPANYGKTYKFPVKPSR